MQEKDTQTVLYEAGPYRLNSPWRGHRQTLLPSAATLNSPHGKEIRLVAPHGPVGCVLPFLEKNCKKLTSLNIKIWAWWIKALFFYAVSTFNIV